MLWLEPRDIRQVHIGVDGVNVAYQILETTCIANFVVIGSIQHRRFLKHFESCSHCMDESLYDAIGHYLKTH